jgi:uridylate kinase
MKYSSVLLKLSGESLAGEDGKGLDEKVLNRYAKEISDIVSTGVGVAVVVGGW